MNKRILTGYLFIVIFWYTFVAILLMDSTSLISAIFIYILLIYDFTNINLWINLFKVINIIKGNIDYLH